MIVNVNDVWLMVLVMDGVDVKDVVIVDVEDYLLFFFEESMLVMDLKGICVGVVCYC